MTANNGSLTYTLDAVGNRSTLASTLAALSAQSFTYDNNDRISGDTFDSNGNTLTSGGTTYTYDYEDRLLTTSSGVTNIYDGDGNRVSRAVGGVTTKFLVDEHNPTGWPQVTEETVSGAVTAQYTHGLMRVSQKRGATVSYYGYDAGGSTRQLFDTSGVVTDTYAYDAFGNTVAQTGSTVNPYQYRGEQYDASLGMYYLRARWYRPQVGRFLTQDAYEGPAVAKPCNCGVTVEGGDVPDLTHHLYGYADVDPIRYVDPSGHANIIGKFFGLPQSVSLLTRAATGGTGGQLWSAARIVSFIFCKVYTVERTAIWATSGSPFEHFPSFVPYSDSLPPYFPHWGEAHLNLFCLARAFPGAPI